jgi:hypothetical protein
MRARRLRLDDGRFEDRETPGIAVDFDRHAVGQDEEWIGMAKVHPGDDRRLESELPANYASTASSYRA